MRFLLCLEYFPQRGYSLMLRKGMFLSLQARRFVLREKDDASGGTLGARQELNKKAG